MKISKVIADLRLPIAYVLSFMNLFSLEQGNEQHDSPGVRKTSNRQLAIGNWQLLGSAIANRQSKIQNQKSPSFPAKLGKQWRHRFDNLIMGRTVARNKAIAVLYLGYVVVQRSPE